MSQVEPRYTLDLISRGPAGHSDPARLGLLVAEKPVDPLRAGDAPDQDRIAAEAEAQRGIVPAKRLPNALEQGGIGTLLRPAIGSDERTPATPLERGAELLLRLCSPFR